MQCKVCGQDNPPEATFCSQCGNVLIAPVEPLHVIEIGVGSSYGNGWRQLWKNFLMLLLIAIITVLISSPGSVGSQIGQKIGGTVAVAGFFFSIVYATFLTNPLAYGVSFVFLKAARNDPLDLGDMFEGFHYYWNAVLASLLVGVIVGIGIVFLIIPGIIFACKLAFTPYLVVDREMKVIDAIQESWRMTTGHAWEVFLIALLGIPIVFAGLLCCVVGVIPAAMWTNLAAASLYHAVSTSGIAPVYEAPPVR